ncbi:MAG: glycine cleavage system aminomethyltransferase GcvT [Cyanobacteriota bacterium]|nr:glycine cleavage system aminomethyltransferase GcvT [Cyanobacteriota bacterium]
MDSLQRTPLWSEHQELGAKFVSFSGWQMPLYYQGILKEHQAVRSQAGVFDISHMGKFLWQGSDLPIQLGQLVPTDLSGLRSGEGQYTVLLNEAGGILDDVIVYKQSDTCWRMISNAATYVKDRDWLRRHLPTLELADLTHTHVLLALQGPEALRQLQPLVQESLLNCRRFQHREVTLAQGDRESIWVARTGYTGEDGFEILLTPSAGRRLWQALMAAQVQPCGLGCRDTLRLEAAMHLYGQDMDETTTPLEAGLKWLITSPLDFVGGTALEQQKRLGISRQLVGLQMLDKAIARHGYPIFAEDRQEASDTPVGVISSGTQSPTLGIPIALAYLPPSLANLGSRVWVEIRQKRYLAVVVKRPFYHSSHPAPR